jgi:hypothetical protein
MATPSRGKVRDRWPTPKVIVRLREALARGDGSEWSDFRLRYVLQFFGYARAPVKAGERPHETGARRMWARRYANGTASTEAVRASGRRNMAKASRARRERRQRLRLDRTCQAGHIWRPDTTYLSTRTRDGKTITERACAVCAKLRYERGKWRALHGAKLKRQVAAARAYMIDVGIRANQQPDSAYWRARYEAAIARWQKLKQAA